MVEGQKWRHNYHQQTIGDRHHIIQGGLEIPCDAIVTMPGTIDNQLILQKYMKFICEKYAEPKEEVIIASFLEPNVIA